MANAIGPDLHVNQRRKRITRSKSEQDGHGSVSEGDSSDGFATPCKRERSMQDTPLQKLNSFASIKYEVIKEKQRHRKTSVRKTKTSKVSKQSEDYEDYEDPELKISARLVDRIAALNDGKRTKVGMANCFEGRTALDVIDVCLKESENMQEDAVALAIATNVYSLRVDRTHNDAHETRYTFIRGKSDAEKAMLLATGENIETTKDKRRRKKAEKDAEARKALLIEKDEYDLINIHQSEFEELSDSHNFDYTFGLKFPEKGCSLQHWSFTQELLERIESRRLDMRKTRKKRKLISWKKIPPLDFFPIYTDFIQVTANLESDRVDALATLRARRDITGKIIFLHDAMVRKPAARSRYSRNVDLPTVKQCRDMLANALQKEPMTWENYLLEDNPRLYKTGQYLRTGDMTGYVFQERPFYHHFDPEKESADDPRETFSYVEKNAEKTLYTFKKPPKGTALARLAPFIRVPVNKYANPRNRRIEDIYFKEDIGVKPIVDGISSCDPKNFTETAWKQLKTQNLSKADVELINFDFSSVESSKNCTVNSNKEEEVYVDDSGKSVLNRLKHRHQKYLPKFETLKAEFKEMARSRCSSIVKELASTSTRLTSVADEEEVDEEDLKEWKTSRFLDTIGLSKEKAFCEDLHDLFSKVFAPSHSKDSDVQQRRQTVASVFGTGREAFEWRVPEGTILSDISYFIKRGIHSDIRYIDATYHMKVFKFKVTVEQAHQCLRQAERIGAGMTPEELAALKQKCFRPGRYNGIRDSGEVSKFYRVDPWSLDVTTVSFLEHYFGCYDYPKLEGALLQLHNDIKEAARNIPLNSWYYATNSEKVIHDDRYNWKTRLNDALSLFTSCMGLSEEKSLWEKRALPKLPRRSLSSLNQHQGSRVLEETGKCEISGGEALVMRNSGGNSDDSDADDELHVVVDRSTCLTPNACSSLENVDNGTTRKNRTKFDDIDDPPRKREKKARNEPEVKAEQLEQVYFTKCDAHRYVSLEDRFSIADARTITRGEDIIFRRRKPLARSLLSEYKFENFVKPGLLYKGVYPGVKMEVKESDYQANNKFSGILTKCSMTEEARCNMVAPDVELDICDAWLTTFGGIRVFPEDSRPSGEVAFGSSHRLNIERENGINFSESENISGNMDDSFNDSVCYPSNSTFKKDRFNDIRLDEFKAIGINLKKFASKKNFDSMTTSEQSASVWAEFEDLEAMGPKKEDGFVINVMGISCRVTPYHLNTAKMKRVMKSILSNPLLAYDKVLYTRRALLARCRAVERNKNEELGPEVYFKKLDRTLDTSLGPVAEKILERRNPVDITALDPVDVLEAVAYRNLEGVDVEEEPKIRCDPTNTGVEESMRQFAAEVRQADFKVQGLHTFSSVMQCLPRRMGNSGKYVNIANALAVTLYMCNENTLTLLQERVNSRDKNASVNQGEPWMGNFIITNAVDAYILDDQHVGTYDTSNTLVHDL